MKILHALSQRPEVTGSGIYLQAMLKGCASWGYENHLLAGLPGNNNVSLDHISESNCDFVRFDGSDFTYPIIGMSDVMPYPSTRFSQLTHGEVETYCQAFIDKLHQMISRSQPDIIHSHHLWFMSSRIKRHFPKIPLLISCHGSDLRQFQNLPHHQEHVKQGCQQADAILALSSVQKNQIIKLYNIDPQKIFVTHAGFNSSLFKPGKKEPEITNILYAGKLSFSKGVDLLLRALKKLEANNWICHLVGGGSGSEKEYIEKHAAQMGSRVKCHGAIEQKNLAKLMATSHIFVLPSLFEGLPLVLLEALASECRIVTNKLPGVIEIFGTYNKEDITLLDMPNLKSIDEIKESAIEDYCSKLAEALQQQMYRVRQGIVFSTPPELINKFTWQKTFEKINSVYQKTLTLH